MEHFEYGEKEMAYLGARDKRLGEAIARIGKVERRVIPDLFSALVHSIVGQQISTKAHEVIWQRIKARLSLPASGDPVDKLTDGVGSFGEFLSGSDICERSVQTLRQKSGIQPDQMLISPEAVAAMPAEELRSLGLSYRKVEYIQKAARKIAGGEFDISALREMDDKSVLAELTKLDGVGVWTAEMLMLHSLRRPDVLSFGDLGIRRGMSLLYHHRELTPEIFERHRRRYSPYGSVASIYLWEISATATSSKAGH